MFKKYQCVKQYSLKDCAASSLKTVLKAYGGDAPLSVLSDLCKTTKNGTNAYNLINAAKELGFDAKGLKINFEELINNKYFYPFIVHTIIDKKYKHYVVIHKINKRKRKILVADPARGLINISFEEFKEIWTNIIITIVPISALPNIKELSSSKRILIELLNKNKNITINIFLLSFLYTVFTIGISFYFKYIIDNNSLHNFYIISIIIFILIIFKVITNYCRQKLLIYTLENIDFNLHSKIFKHILSLPYRIMKNKSTGEIISRINDLSNIKELIAKIIVNVAIDLLTALGGLIVIYSINPTLFGVTIIILILYLIIYFIFKDKLNSLTKDIYQAYGKYSAYMNESVYMLESIKSNNIERNVEAIYENKYIEVLKASMKRNKLEIIAITMKDLVNFLGNAFVLFVGTLMVMEGSITLGTLIMFVNLMSYFLEPIRNLIDMDSIIRNSITSLERIKDILQIEKEKETGIEPKYLNGDIKIKDLTFTYDNSRNILKSINLEIKKGEKILITGASGCGKSTLLKLIYGYYKIERGAISIDDIDVLDYNKRSLRNKIGYVSQNENIFTDTIFNNITCYRTENYNKVLKISKALHVEEFIREEKCGYNFLLEENGFNISGGQKQRIILARNLLFAKNIILLDEATNQVSIDLERGIFKNMFNHFINSTFIVVSHRKENSDLFDKMFSMNNGTLKAIKL